MACLLLIVLSLPTKGRLPLCCLMDLLSYSFLNRKGLFMFLGWVYKGPECRRAFNVHAIVEALHWLV